ncbi:MAG: phosphohydrolase, partial [Petrimonas sp.]|nr:phosphohydrolase [Petrimonas sp.]
LSADRISTNMYSKEDDSIDILYKNETIKDISKASDMMNIELLSKSVEKFYFAYFRT